MTRNLFHDFVYDIKTEKNKEQKEEMLLKLDDEQFFIVEHLYSPEQLPLTLAELRGHISEGIFNHKLVKSMVGLIRVLQEPVYDKKILAYTILTYLGMIEYIAGWKECRKASNIIFRKVKIGLRRRDIKKIKYLRKSKKCL